MSLPSLLRRWIPLALFSAGLPLLVYVTVQQALRTGADDPQIQLAEDAALALEGGAPATSVIPAARVDAGRSLAPFVIVYDASGVPTAGNGTLNGRLPSPPAGVFQFVREHGEERVTWMPDRTVRFAAVVRLIPGNGGGFVLAARSLREVEGRERYTRVACAAMIVVLALGSLALLAAGDAVFGATP